MRIAGGLAKVIPFVAVFLARAAAAVAPASHRCPAAGSGAIAFTPGGRIGRVIIDAARHERYSFTDRRIGLAPIRARQRGATARGRRLRAGANAAAESLSERVAGGVEVRLGGNLPKVTIIDAGLPRR